MYRDPSKFRERFKAYKEGKSVREIYGLPGYRDGSTPELSPDELFVELMGPLLYRELLYQGVQNPDAAYKNMITQLAYESNRGRSRVARELHNYGGVGWNGKEYFRYKNDADFVHDYVKLMNRRYKSAISADTLYDYAKAIKKLGYYEDTLENYSRNLIGMKSLHKAALAHKTANPLLYKIEKTPTLSVKPIVATPDALRVATTIPQEKVIDYTDRRNTVGAEIDRSIWAHNVMNNIQGMAYDVPIWESKSLPALEPIDLDVTPFKTYEDGKISLGHKQIPIDKARIATEPDYTKDGWLLGTLKRGANNFIKTVEYFTDSARRVLNGRGSTEDKINVALDLGGVTGAKAVAKVIRKAKAIKPPKASTKFKTNNPNVVGKYYTEHPEEVIPITDSLELNTVVDFLNNHVGPKYAKQNGIHVGINPKDINLGYADFSGTKLGGYVGPSGEVVINKDILNDPQTLQYVLGHEIGGHWFDKHYPLTASQMSVVGYGMPFDQAFLNDRPWMNAIAEANAERRAFELMNYFDKGIVGNDLDNAIKGMPMAEAKRYIDRLGYSKGINWLWPDLLPFKLAVTSIPATGAGVYLAGNEEYKNGKLPGYKIGHNPSNANINSDGTFTDDYTKLFDDIYITPKKVDLKYGSHTLNNFPKYLANRTAWMLTSMPMAVLNDKPLERVYPEFDLLLGSRQITNELLPLKSSINRELINYNKIREQIAKMKSDDDAFRAAHPEYEIENILQKPKLEDASVIDELVKRTNLEDRSFKGIFEKILYENKDLHGKLIVNLHNNRARLSGDFIDNVGQVFDVDTPEGYENAILFLEKYYFGTRDGAERLLKDPDFLSHLKGFSIPRGSRPVFISKSKLIQRQEQDLGRKLTQQEADDLYYKTISHERHHSFDKIHNTPEGFNLEGLSPDDYFVKDGFDELAARGTQLKNMFGLYKNPLTAAHLRYASSLYFKDPSNINNNMTRFFNMISDYDKAAKWLQENATGILPFAIGGSVVASMPEYKDGKITIKPANRGKFNATKKRTGKTTEELTHSKNPLTRKRAIFALNSRKWSHK